ncbi:dystonin-like isoform X3 [Mizuhopecten yessoensis]|uniref:dystonin-like isoform X3 n=1 Tax=Mizuhopecten yessoensis TaxID=6573 RepID=UPI000B457A86|nr:dystonin-like isoform X3 [Mizuhopecten yessoensis]
MGSRRDGGGPDQYIGIIKDKQKLVQEIPFSNNYIGIQQALEETKERTDQIKSIKRKVDEVKRARRRKPSVSHAQDCQNLEQEYVTLEDQALQKKRCLETLLYVNEVEDVLQNVQSEFEERALYLTERKKVFESVYREDDVEASARMHKDCVYALHHSWEWLTEVSGCIHQHIRHAGEYHRFYHDIQFLDEDMKYYMGLMNSERMRSKVETREPEVFINHLKDVTRRLLDFQARVDRLSDTSTSVYPVHLRRDTPVYPTKVKSLVAYRHQEITLEAGEECFLLDNSDASRWQIRSKSGAEAEVPGVILVIPPPEKKAIIEAHRIKEQMIVHWDTTLKRLRTQLTQFLTNSIDDTPSSEMGNISTSQKADLMKLMNEAVQLLRPLTADDPDFRDMMSNVTKFRKVLSQVKPGDNDTSSGSAQRWRCNGKVLTHYKDLLTYAKSYKEHVASMREQEKLLIRENTETVFSSKAYFERALPLVDVDLTTKETVWSSIKSDIYIHERQKGGRPVAPPRKRRQLKRVVSVATTGESVADLPDSVEESSSFVMTGVLDPRTRQKMSVFQAMSQGILDPVHGKYINPDTGETMSIPEAIHKGLIQVDYREHLTNGGMNGDGFSPLRNTMDTKIFPVAGVVDPRTGEWIGVKEAISAGILDPSNGKYRNIVTGEEVDLLEAVQNGYLVVDPALLDGYDGSTPFTFVEFTDVSYRVTGVIDPTTGQEVSLKQAITAGYIDEANSLYRNPHTGEEIPLEDAIRQGLVKCQPLRSSEKADPNEVLTVQQLQVKQQKFVSGDGDNVDGFDELDGLRNNPNRAMYDKVRKYFDPNERTVIDPSDNLPISLEEAFEKDIIDFAKGEFKTSNGEKLSLEQAASRNLIEPELLKEILEAYKENSLGELIDSGRFDGETGLVTDPKSGHSLSLQAAIAQKLVDPNLIFLYDMPSQKLISLATAIEEGRYDLTTGQYCNPLTGELLSLSQAEKVGLVKCRLDPDAMARTAQTLERLQKLMDTSIPAVKSPYSDGTMTLEEAIKAGILNVQQGEFWNPRTAEVVPLTAAFKAEKVNPHAAMSLLDALDKLSLQQAIDDGYIDPTTGEFIPSERARPISIQEAIGKGLLNLDNVFVVDKDNDNIVSLGTLVASGKFDPATGTVIDPNTGQNLSLAEAIARGVIDAGIRPDQFIDSSVTLKELIDSGKVNPRTTDFCAPNDHKMSLRDALANGFLTMNSKVKMDHESGCVVLGSDEEVVKALVDIRENSEWLHGIEQALVSRQKPSQRLERIRLQKDATEALKTEIANHEPEVTSSIKQSEELIENNKSQMKEDGAQQLQKLRFNVSDLKVRFDAAFGETRSRCTRLDKMADDLEEFYNSLQDLDQWLDTAIEKSQDLQASRDDPEVQHREYKDFVEELQEKEMEMMQTFQMADSFRDGSQDFEREAETYRQKINVLPPISEEADNDVIDDEIEALEAKYKDISRDCTKQLDKLSAIMKMKKTFDDLNDKLNGMYPGIENKLRGVNEEEFGRVPERDTKDLYTLKDLKAELIGQERRLKDITQMGDKLCKSLNDMNMKKKSDEVQKSVQDHKQIHEVLQKEIAGKEEQLDAAVSQQQNVLNRLDGLYDWMTESENILNEKKQISLEKDRMAQQLKEQRLMNAEIESNKALLERLSAEAGDMSNGDDAQKTVFDLSERIMDVDEKAEHFTHELEDVVGMVNDLEADIGQMDGWLTDSVASLKSRNRGTSQKATKARVDELYQEKREREIDMENLRAAAKRVMDDERVCDQFALKECLGEVEGKWHELTEHLVQQVSLEALTEIDGMLKYLDKAENEINTAEPISIEPDTLTVQLKDHLSFNDDLNQKRNAVKDIINKCNRMLRETTNSQTDEIKTRLDSIRTQADIVCQLSAERLHQLEAALPLATHFSENQTEIQGWLDEMEADIKSQGTPGENLEQVRKQLDTLKSSLQKVDDHKPFIDDLNDTGLELMELCGDDDAGEIQNKLIGYNGRYEKLKGLSKEKEQELTKSRTLMTQDVSDSLDNLLDDLSNLNRNISTANPIPANPDKLKDELKENQVLMTDLERLKPSLVSVEESVKRMLAQGMDDQADGDDLKQKVTEIATLNNQIRDGSLKRDRALMEASQVADRFFDVCADTMSNLRDLKDNLLSQEPPGIDPATVKEQQKELKDLRKELGKSRLSLEECRESGEKLSGLCGDPGLVEIRKQLEDIHNIADDVHDIARDREDDLKSALTHADKFQNLLDSVTAWLPMSEHQLDSLKPVSSQPEIVKQQIDELKEISAKSQIHPHVVDMQQLNQELSTLKDMSPIAAESLHRPVDDVNGRWNAVLKTISDREAKLKAMQLKLGEIEEGMDEAIDCLTHVHEDLATFDDVSGDPKCLETHMKKLQLQLSDLKAQETNCKNLSNAVTKLLSQESEDSPALKEKRDVMNDLMRAAQANGKDKEAKLQERLRQVKKYLGDVDDLLQWVNDLRMELKSVSPFGALPETSKTQYDAYLARYEAFNDKDEMSQALIAKGQKMSEKCDPDDVTQICDRLRKLKDRWNDTKDRAQKRKEKLSEHLENVDEFHGTLKTFTDWLNNAEIAMRNFKYPSKLVDRVTVQLEEHNKMKMELDQHSERMQTLDRTGSYLKHFCRKQDTIYIKNLLVGIRLRWKKLLRRTDERGRLLTHAHREDKRFYDAWKGLCDWLDESSKTVARFMSPVAKGSATKENIDDLKRFQHELAGKHTTFYSATRLGRNLKDRCTKSDPEREVLQQMLDDLKDKWNSVRSVISRSQNKLDEALLTSGRVTDALTSLLEWLGKAEATLAEDQPVLGDLDTIHMLIEQHKGMQQELGAREQTVAAMKAAGNVSASHLEELETTWDRVNRLSDHRENKLRDSLQLAEEFQDVVQVMREFLPQAEAELKYRALPDDEVAIIQLIEKHEKFQEDLRNHQDCVDKIKLLAEEILQNCHPNAIRFVKYYLTITQTRWDQLLQRAKNRGQRLQEALRSIQGNAALVEDLLAWLTDAQVLLSTKERDPIPDDLKVVEDLYKDHVEFHDEITSKNNDVERLTKIINSEPKSPGRIHGSNMKLNENDIFNPRVITLQNKWRIVWRMSVDRKKNLQDALDTLLELESFKTFDFGVWKAKYLNWIKAKKMRVTDFFRRQDKRGDGLLLRDDFVNGMLITRFPTNRTELHAVFDIFDRDGRDVIEYKDFIEALKPTRHQKTRLNSSNRQMTDAELIHDNVEKEISGCQCRNSFRAERLSEGKYRFGEKQNIRLVRFLNSTVMVRVGGGWVTLDEFLETNDPCRAKGRSNFDLRDTLSPDGQTSFRTRKGSGTFGYKSKLNDTGYASSVSSAGSSGDRSLRRSRVTSSMVNLSGAGGSLSVNRIHKNADFGSTGSLTRTKRLSTSSTNVNSPTSTRTRNPSTPTQSRLNNTISRSTTPQPTPTYVSRSKTPTPRSSSSSRPPGTPNRTTSTPTPKTSTPTRTGRTTPTFTGRTTPSGRTTPTMSNGPGNTRRLPSTPKNAR